jgi:F0F1-type ATP synthase membrane subunit c/vacuolar-type H+-ATPase subunit K
MMTAHAFAAAFVALATLKTVLIVAVAVQISCRHNAGGIARKPTNNQQHTGVK